MSCSIRLSDFAVKQFEVGFARLQSVMTYFTSKRQTKCMDDVFAAQAAGVRSAML